MSTSAHRKRPTRRPLRSHRMDDAWCSWRSETGSPQLFLRSLDADNLTTPEWDPVARRIRSGLPTAAPLGSSQVLNCGESTSLAGSCRRWPRPGPVRVERGHRTGRFCSHRLRPAPVPDAAVGRRACRCHHARRGPGFAPVSRVSSWWPAIPGPRNGIGFGPGAGRGIDPARSIPRTPGGSPTPTTAGDYLSSGWPSDARQGTLMALRSDPARREISGDPVMVAESVVAAWARRRLPFPQRT